VPEPSTATSDAPFGDLGRLAIGRTDKGPEWHNFTEVYERFFLPMRTRPIRILEIGIDQGGSLLMWSDYFPNAEIFGIDILDCSSMETDRVRTFVADQSKREQLGAFLAKYPGPYDIVLDDGGHSMEQQQVSLGFLFPHVRPGGYYVVEDVHTSLPVFYPHRGFAVAADGTNSTLLMLETFVRTGRFESRYLTPGEAAFLGGEVELTNLFHRHRAAPSVTCILQRKATR
jgi:demethylmacrocin O-methyltransferase